MLGTPSFQCSYRTDTANNWARVFHRSVRHDRGGLARLGLLEESVLDLLPGAITYSNDTLEAKRGRFRSGRGGGRGNNFEEMSMWVGVGVGVWVTTVIGQLAVVVKQIGADG